MSSGEREKPWIEGTRKALGLKSPESLEKKKKFAKGATREERNL